MEKKVTIIIPVAKSSKTIRRTITSCLKQTYKNIEILIVLNNTDVYTRNIVYRMEQHTNKIKVLEILNGGRSAARNYGIKNATGSYIQFVDADDTLNEDKIRVSMRFFYSNVEYSAFYTRVRYVDERKNIVVKESRTLRDYDELLYNNLFPINSLIIKNDNIVFFKENIDSDEDWLFWVENIYGKLVGFDNQFYGGVVYITGNNSMGNVENMMLSSIRVRMIIRKTFKDNNIIKKMKTDIKYVLEYLFFRNLGLTIESTQNVKSEFGSYYYLSYMLYKIPFFREKWQKIFCKMINENIYK